MKQILSNINKVLNLATVSIVKFNDSKATFFWHIGFQWLLLLLLLLLRFAVF